ncbi:MAG: DUF6249 domain-containing protein [Saprospiraceae bacterium]|jgi:hypothetical protein
MKKNIRPKKVINCNLIAKSFVQETNKQLNKMNEEIVIPLGFFAAVFGVFYMYLSTRNKERMALIEKDANARMFQSGNANSNKQIILSIGFLGIGIGLGVLVGGIFEQLGLSDSVAYPASIFIFAGLGLVGSLILFKRLFSKDQHDDTV